MTADGTQITTAAELDALAVGTRFRDNMGDIGTVVAGRYVTYRETAHLPFAYVAKHYLPAIVIGSSDVPQPTPVPADAVERAARAWHAAAEQDSRGSEPWEALADDQRTNALRYMTAALAAAGAGAGAGEAYREGRWCGECCYGVVEDPPCCTQPAGAQVDREAFRFQPRAALAAARAGEAEHACADERLTDSGPICRQCGEAADREALARVQEYVRARTEVPDWFASDAVAVVPEMTERDGVRPHDEVPLMLADLLALLAARGDAAPTVTAERLASLVEKHGPVGHAWYRQGSGVVPSLWLHRLLIDLGIEVTP